LEEAQEADDKLKQKFKRNKQKLEILCQPLAEIRELIFGSEQDRSSKSIGDECIVLTLFELENLKSERQMKVVEA